MPKLTSYPGSASLVDGAKSEELGSPGPLLSLNSEVLPTVMDPEALQTITAETWLEFNSSFLQDKADPETQSSDVVLVLDSDWTFLIEELDPEALGPSLHELSFDTAELAVVGPTEVKVLVELDSEVLQTILDPEAL